MYVDESVCTAFLQLRKRIVFECNCDVISVFKNPFFVMQKVYDLNIYITTIKFNNTSDMTKC